MSYFKTIIVAGKTIEVYKSYSKRIGSKIRGNKDKATPEEMEKVNQINAETKLRRLINANFKEGDFHLVLTYKRELRPTPEGAKDNIKDFLDEMRKEYKKIGEPLKYVHVTEYKNTAIHHHLIINDIENQNVSKQVRKLWTFGNPKFTPLDGTGQYKDLAAYLIKETSETYKENDGGHKQRYSCSRNLYRPLPKEEVIKKATNWLADPKPIKGYYIDQDTIVNGVDKYTGREYQRYTMIKLDDGTGG